MEKRLALEFLASSEVHRDQGWGGSLHMLARITAHHDRNQEQAVEDLVNQAAGQAACL